MIKSELNIKGTAKANELVEEDLRSKDELSLARILELSDDKAEEEDKSENS